MYRPALMQTVAAYTRSSRVSRGVSALPTGRAALFYLTPWRSALPLQGHALSAAYNCPVTMAPPRGQGDRRMARNYRLGAGREGRWSGSPRPYYTIQTFYVANGGHNMLWFIFYLPGFLTISSTFLGIPVCSHAVRILGRRIFSSGIRRSDGCRCT